MKRKLIGMCVAVCMAGAAWGEIIQTVGYNPARFGEYKRLKVTSGMETGGALVSPTLDGNGRSVTLSACEGQCEEAAYRVERIESVNNGTVTSTGMTATTVNGARGTVNVGNNSEIKSAVKGGEVAVKQLSASGSGLSVSENLTLGGNKIKKPGYKNCQWKWETITHEGGSAKVLALAGCSDICNNPSAQERCETESHGGGIGTWNQVTCQCDCPSGMELDMHGQCDCENNKEWDSASGTCKEKTSCADESYLLANKTECCPAQPTINTACWRVKMEWKKSASNTCNLSLAQSKTAPQCWYLLRPGNMGGYDLVLAREQCAFIKNIPLYGTCVEAGSSCSSENEERACKVDITCTDNSASNALISFEKYVCQVTTYEKNGW